MKSTFKILWFSTLIIVFSCNTPKDIDQSLLSLDDKDFNILNTYFQDKAIVGIGEYTHGDGELFELKTEIIEHLHKNLGFEAVLMESDFLAVEKTLGALDTLSLKDAANVGIQSTWADSKEYLSFIRYLQSSAEKGDTLYFHGFDSQMTGKESLNIHLDQLEQIKKKLSLEEYDNLIKSLNIVNSRNISEISLDSLVYLKQTVSGALKTEKLFSDKSIRWLKNIEGNLNQLILIKEAPPVNPQNISEILAHPNYINSGNIRDSLMAENVKYYLKKYNKVIIWAANKHLQTKSTNEVWMGELLKKSFGEKYYAVLVVYDRGEWSYPAGRPNGKIPASVEGTLTFEISNATDSEVSFLNINTTEIPRMKVRTNNWMITDSIDVSEYGDAFLYVRNATGSIMADR